MYKHISAPQFKSAKVGQRLLVIGQFHRTVSRNFLYIRNYQPIVVIGEPIDWLLPHHSRLEVWGQLIAAQPPVLQLHGARKLGSSEPIRHIPQALEGLVELDVQVTQHGSDFLASTAYGQNFLLDWANPIIGRHIVEGWITGLSPPLLKVNKIEEFDK